LNKHPVASSGVSVSLVENSSAGHDYLITDCPEHNVLLDTMGLQVQCSCCHPMSTSGIQTISFEHEILMDMMIMMMI
jgi:hypothetical protein